MVQSFTVLQDNLYIDEDSRAFSLNPSLFPPAPPVIDLTQIARFVPRTAYSFCLAVSDRCNLRCSYCFNKSKSGQRMSLEQAKDILNNLFSLFPDGQKYFVDLSGIGEPLLNLDVILPLADYCHEISNRIMTEVLPQFVCNGTLLTPKVAKLLQDHEILFGVSLDGNEEINDRYRGKGTFKTVLDNVMSIANRDYIGCAATIGNDSFPLLESIQGYSLADRMRDNFLSDKQLSSPEIMFSVRYLAPNITHSMDLYYGAWTTCGVTRDLVDEFECTDGLKWGESPLTVSVDESLLNTNAIEEENYNEREKLFQNRDPRLRETVTHSGYATFPDEGYEENGRIKMTDQQQTGFGMMKLLQPTTVMPSYSTISDADVVILRYAEVLLMIAEAENEANGPTQKVYDAINAVRARSEMPSLPEGLSQEEMRERIRHEYRVELAFEGQRYFQLKRWKLMEKLVNGAVDPALPAYIKVFKPAFYYWPIPQSEIDKAGGILEQDSNYA